MSSSKIVAVLGLVLLVGFFLPWISGAETLSGFSFAKGWVESEGNRVLGIILFLAPVGALFAVLLGALGRAHGLVAFFTGLIIPILVALLVVGSEPGQLDAWKQSISYGFWMVIGGSVGLLVFAFTKSDSKKQLRRR